VKNDIHTYPPGTKLAFDVNISDRTMGRYARDGCVIVFVAKDGQPDEEWIWQAYEAGAEVVLSYDLDIPNLIEKENLLGMKWREP
jgi:hypothetical protein